MAVCRPAGLQAAATGRRRRPGHRCRGGRGSGALADGGGRSPQACKRQRLHVESDVSSSGEETYAANADAYAAEAVAAGAARAPPAAPPAEAGQDATAATQADPQAGATVAAAGNDRLIHARVSRVDVLDVGKACMVYARESADCRLVELSARWAVTRVRCFALEKSSIRIAGEIANLSRGCESIVHQFALSSGVPHCSPSFAT